MLDKKNYHLPFYLELIINTNKTSKKKKEKFIQRLKAINLNIEYNSTTYNKPSITLDISFMSITCNKICICIYIRHKDFIQRWSRYFNLPDKHSHVCIFPYNHFVRESLPYSFCKCNFNTCDDTNGVNQQSFWLKGATHTKQLLEPHKSIPVKWSLNQHIL